MSHIHQIILALASTARLCCKTLFLAITMRLSKKFIEFENNHAVLCNSKKLLHLANDAERQMIFKLKGQENKRRNFEYPSDLDFTLNPGDLSQDGLNVVEK